MSLQMLETHRFAAVELFGKLANICADLPSTALETSSMFKQLTGFDEIAVERKYHAPHKMAPFARMLFSANEYPRSKDATGAFFQRWLVLRFDRVYRGEAGEMKRNDLDARLAAPSELSGVLNRALAMLPAVLKDGIPVTLSMAEAHAEFWKATDPVAVWLLQHTVAQPLAQTPCAELLAAFNDNALSAGRSPMTATAFGLALRNLRPEIERKQRVIGGELTWCYIGVGLKTAESKADA
jgi:phage/plasmid-associated DNA primase